MLFALLTLLTSISLAGVVGWFSVSGIMTIYAGAPFHAALVMGIAMEFSKLVSLSWLYRNWQHANLLFKVPLITIALVVMIITNIGVFGFLSKSHLEQGASTIDNSAKVEQIVQSINQEKSRITDNEKIIAQMDGAVNSLIGKDQATRSLTVRKGQAIQRKELRDEIDSSQKQIDNLNQEKFTLESAVRKLQLEVGPIRYISEIFYGKDNSEKNMESAVQLFTLLIILILDPTAVMLLLAANNSLSRLRYEKKPKAVDQEQSSLHNPGLGVSSTDIEIHVTNVPSLDTEISTNKNHTADLHHRTVLSDESNTVYEEILQDSKIIDEEKKIIPSTRPMEEILERNRWITTEPEKKIETPEVIINEKEQAILANFGEKSSFNGTPSPAIILQPTITKILQDQNNDIANDKRITDKLPAEPTIWHWGTPTLPLTTDKKIKTMSWINEFGEE